MNYIVYILLGVIVVCLVVIAMLLSKVLKLKASDQVDGEPRRPKNPPVPPEPTPPLPVDPPAITPKPAPIPNDVAFDENNLPYRTSRSDKKRPSYGRGFNAYTTKGGKRYHKRTCNQIRKNKNVIIKHIYECIYDDRLTACTYCKPKSKIDDWYISKFPYSKYSIKKEEPQQKSEQLSLFDEKE